MKSVKPTIAYLNLTGNQSSINESIHENCIVLPFEDIKHAQSFAKAYLNWIEALIIETAFVSDELESALNELAGSGSRLKIGIKSAIMIDSPLVSTLGITIWADTPTSAVIRDWLALEPVQV